MIIEKRRYIKKAGTLFWLITVLILLMTFLPNPMKFILLQALDLELFLILLMN